MNELRLPKPIPLGPRMYAIVSAAVLGAVTGPLVVNGVLHIREHNALTGVTIATAMLTAVLVIFVTRMKGNYAPLLASLMAVPLGALNCGLSVFISEILDGKADSAWGSMLMGTVFGVACGAPFGLGYALVLALPCHLVTKVRDVAGPGAGLRARLPFALLLLVPSVVFKHPIPIVADVGVLVALLGFGLCAADVVRWRHLRAALRAGRREGLVSVPLSAFMDSDKAHALPEATWRAVGAAASKGQRDLLLARSPQSTPFRDAERIDPVAIIGDWGGDIVCDGDALRAGGR